MSKDILLDVFENFRYYINFFFIIVVIFLCYFIEECVF